MKGTDSVVLGSAAILLLLGWTHYLTYVSVVGRTQEEMLPQPSFSTPKPTSTTTKAPELVYTHTEVASEAGGQVAAGGAAAPNTPYNDYKPVAEKTRGIGFSLPVTVGLIMVGGLLIVIVADAVMVYFGNK